MTSGASVLMLLVSAFAGMMTYIGVSERDEEAGGAAVLAALGAGVAAPFLLMAYLRLIVWWAGWLGWP